MWVPPPYVDELFALLDNGNGYISPRMLWTTAERALADPLRSVDCAMFIDWCRCAAAGGVGADNPLRPTRLQNPMGLWLDGAIGRQRANIVSADCPSVQPAATTAVVVQPLVEAIGLWRAEAALREDNKAEQRKLEKAEKGMPSRRWPFGVRRLLNLCLVDDESLLPPVWSALCLGGVKLDRSTLASFCDSPGLDADLSLRPFAEPVISIDVARDAGQLKFIEGRDTNTGCLSIFAFCFPDQATISTANKGASLHDQQNAGGMTVTLAEATKLSLIQAVKLPDSWPEIKRIIFAYHHWLQVVMGENHVVPIAFQAMAEQMDGLSVELESKTRSDISFRAGLLQSMHYHTWTWVNKQQRSGTAVAALDYTSISEGLSLGNWFAPKLPPIWSASLLPPQTWAERHRSKHMLRHRRRRQRRTKHQPRSRSQWSSPLGIGLQASTIQPFQWVVSSVKPKDKCRRMRPSSNSA
jgi:hypothetical protein